VDLRVVRYTRSAATVFGLPTVRSPAVPQVTSTLAAQGNPTDRFGYAGPVGGSVRAPDHVLSSGTRCRNCADMAPIRRSIGHRDPKVGSNSAVLALESPPSSCQFSEA
jgi:hypothetical protein